MKKITINGYTRVSFPTARVLYNSGVTIRIVPCKYHPNNDWIFCDVNCNDGKLYDPTPSADELRFSVRVARFEGVNCGWETGYYASYWVHQNELK